MPTTRTIALAREFAREPYGRFPEHGDFNGERFRHEFLLPALAENDVVHVDLGGAVGYGSSFLEEAFGGLVRLGYYDKPELKNRLVVRHPLALHSARVKRYIEDAVFGIDSDKRKEVEGRYHQQ